MNFLDIKKGTTVDGDGFRVAIYLAGCENHCEGCFNPESWDYNAGKELTGAVALSIKDYIYSNPMISGVSLLGGDPFAPKNREELYFLVDFFNFYHINIWCWTGYTYEQLIKDDLARKSLEKINVLVDGRFVKALKNPLMRFRGSSNQRIIKLKDNSFEIDKFIE